MKPQQKGRPEGFNAGMGEVEATDERVAEGPSRVLDEGGADARKLHGPEESGVRSTKKDPQRQKKVRNRDRKNLMKTCRRQSMMTRKGRNGRRRRVEPTAGQRDAFVL